jgi:hypothetical protein
MGNESAADARTAAMYAAATATAAMYAAATATMTTAAALRIGGNCTHQRKGEESEYCFHTSTLERWGALGRSA